MDEERENERRQYRDMAEDYPDQAKSVRGVENRFDRQLTFVSGATGVSAFLGLNSSVPGDEPSRQILVAFVPIALSGLSFMANKASFHHGAKLAASGDRLATVLVLGWFMLMAVTVGTIGFAGVSHEIVETAKLREPGRHMAKANRLVGEAAADAKRIVPLISSGADDISSIISCEQSRGCVSGRSGRGSMVTRLEALANRFKTLQTTYAKAEKRRAQQVRAFEALAVKYEGIITKDGGAGESRAKLVAVYNQAQSLITDLANAVPTTAAKALISELRSTATQPALMGRIDVEARLRGHADRLEEALDDVSRISVALPPFPEPSGLTVGWERLDLTAPLAVVLFGLEIILVILWCLLVRDFKARRKSAARGKEPPDAPPTANAGALVAHYDAYAPRQRRT